MASGAIKFKNKISTIPGTKPSIKNAQLLISTGIPSLDHMIGLCVIFFCDIIISLTFLYFFRWRFTYWFNICNWYVFYYI